MSGIFSSQLTDYSVVGGTSNYFLIRNPRSANRTLVSRIWAEVHDTTAPIVKSVWVGVGWGDSYSTAASDTLHNWQGDPNATPSSLYSLISGSMSSYLLEHRLTGPGRVNLFLPRPIMLQGGFGAGSYLLIEVAPDVSCRFSTGVVLEVRGVDP